jgi:peptide/nickel transport system permease protein
LSKVVQGDLGYSYFFNLPVSELIIDRLPATLLLVLASVLMAFLIGTTLGVLSSRKPNGLLSQLVNVVSLVGFAAPVFWTGMLLVILFASVFPWFPISGMRSVELATDATGWADIVDVLHHLVLPTATLALVYIAQYSRLARASMLDVLGSDFIRTARAKGLPERIVLYKHALRNAVLPVITILGLQFGNVLAGAILVETVFNWPGLGRLAFDSVLRRDYPTILGVLLFSSVVVVLMNQLTDVAYRLIDPRIKL